MALRMEKESWQTQLNESWQNQLSSLDARLRRVEQRAREVTTAAPAVAVAAPPPVVPSRRPESVAAKDWGNDTWLDVDDCSFFFCAEKLCFVAQLPSMY